MIRKFEKNFKKYIIEVMRIITIRMVIVVKPNRLGVM